jgi:hypothetical protein
MNRGPMDWITTFSGGSFYPLAPKAEELNIRDIAHALSNMCRYNGHTKKHYSVAQHSVLVAENLPDHKLWGLLHDASEAYLPDVPRPVKKHLYIWDSQHKKFRGFSEVEDEILLCVAERWKLPWPVPPIVKEVDTQSIASERESGIIVKGKRPWGAWIKGINPWSKRIYPWPAKVAEAKFLEAFMEYSGRTK